jgi:hypothetical protein
MEPLVNLILLWHGSTVSILVKNGPTFGIYPQLIPTYQEIQLCGGDKMVPCGHVIPQLINQMVIIISALTKPIPNQLGIILQKLKIMVLLRLSCMIEMEISLKVKLKVLELVYMI